MRRDRAEGSDADETERARQWRRLHAQDEEEEADAKTPMETVLTRDVAQAGRWAPRRARRCAAC